jgi:hypothetical protein
MDIDKLINSENLYFEKCLKIKLESLDLEKKAFLNKISEKYKNLDIITNLILKIYFKNIEQFKNTKNIEIVNKALTDKKLNYFDVLNCFKYLSIIISNDMLLNEKKYNEIYKYITPDILVDYNVNFFESFDIKNILSIIKNNPEIIKNDINKESDETLIEASQMIFDTLVLNIEKQIFQDGISIKKIEEELGNVISNKMVGNLKSYISFSNILEESIKEAMSNNKECITYYNDNSVRHDNSVPDDKINSDKLFLKNVQKKENVKMNPIKMNPIKMNAIQMNDIQMNPIQMNAIQAAGGDDNDLILIENSFISQLNEIYGDLISKISNLGLTMSGGNKKCKTKKIRNKKNKTIKKNKKNKSKKYKQKGGMDWLATAAAVTTVVAAVGLGTRLQTIYNYAAGSQLAQATTPVVNAVLNKFRVDYSDRLNKITRKINNLDIAINNIINEKIEIQKNVANNSATQEELNKTLVNLRNLKTKTQLRDDQLSNIRNDLSRIKEEAQQKFKTETESFNNLEIKFVDLNKEISELERTQYNFIKTKFPERLDNLKVSLEGYKFTFNLIESDKTRYIRQQEEWEEIIRNIAARPMSHSSHSGKPNKKTLYDFKTDVTAKLESTKKNISEINAIKIEIDQFVISTGRQLTYLNELSRSNIDRFTRVKANLEEVLEKQKTIISSLCPDATPAQQTEMQELRRTLNALKPSITTINLSLTQKDTKLNSNTLTTADIRGIERELTATDTRLTGIRDDLRTASGTIERLKFALNRELSSLDSLIKEVNNSYSQTVNMLKQIKTKARLYTPYVPPAPPPPPPVWANRIPLDLNTTPRTTQDWTLPVDPRSGWITGDIQPADYHNKRNFRSNTDRNIMQKCFPNAYYPAPFDRYAICKPLDWNRRNPQQFFNTDRTSLYDICEWINQTDNEVVVFHGTHLKKIREFFGGRQTNDNLNTIGTNHGHLLGQGFYVTFNPNEALGYVKQTPPWGSTPVPRGMYTPAIYEIVLSRANEYLRGSHESRDPLTGLINQQGELFHFIQNNHRTTAKEQIALIHEVNAAFRATINKDKIHVHTYANGTTVEAGNHDQNNDFWGPSPRNQNIPYLRDIGYRNRYTYPI